MLTPPTAEFTKLRTGFSTGAYLSATAVAALRLLRGHTHTEPLRLKFPDGKERAIALQGSELISSLNARAWAIKDAGEDIDVTNGLRITTEVWHGQSDSPTNPADYELQVGHCRVRLRGGSGVGKVTRPGLDAPEGKWAINPTPQTMLAANLAANGAEDYDDLLIEISIERGEEVAQRTLNPKLGVTGGLSILGTSGIVIPCSHAAYTATIEILARGAAREACPEVALVTGGRSHRWLCQHIPQIPEHAIIRFGDFIRESLEICQRHKIQTVHVVCMMGKLAKYALGVPYTHARENTQSPEKVAALLIDGGMSAERFASADQCRSIRELMLQLTEPEQSVARTILTRHAHAHLTKWFGSDAVCIHILDTSGNKELS
ncbi:MULTISPECIES: cobalt-precorrin-5B (C(1))-methyltransferase CbiD [unclassified Lentimonas]|uniref:cobalt-precorrin-5B (C(1))-methyltransferase CbiD n=1 Tax=unclassified Lentimonas TaxID=2630993 RepID=UPI00132C9F65|nr:MULTISPECIES: cobalt-precorrin-5B (C(1))-methyltransferase CbiD [unclassified Lentimonas]CAA6691578.1 Cobalt-precorrin-6 synthase, anaerobic [Lentimonas sp. CC10]CAA6696245.1 Cobalt-precorrin-6 synthase, anaerobic [Lentimonas sp. CC19]CAA7070864.1 Cobalt-precorrin-6 synthase, anaerobic [Lentimonas sp. CC11]